jgi:hypothetical protein
MGYSSGIGIGSQRPGVCTSTTKPASPFTGQVIYMTDTDETAVWDGTYWEGLNRSRDRNVIINGAMQVAQRGTSTASITTDGYYTADRFNTSVNTLGTWTQSVEADAPTGSGLRNSLKMLCTTADASPASSDRVWVNQLLEGQNLQQFLKGTSSAKQFSLSFWVKSNVTGTYIAHLWDLDNTRHVSASYTISASATWEKKTITFPADTTGAFDNNNDASLRVLFPLAAGSTWTSGTLDTTWATSTNANKFVGQTNLASATNNYWQVTGVQLEAGAVATPFEFEDYGTTLQKCKRYYHREGDTNYHFYTTLVDWATGSGYATFRLPVEMRTLPTLSYSSLSNFSVYATGSTSTPTGIAEWVTSQSSGKLHVGVVINASNFSGGSKSGWFTNGGTPSGFIQFSAEL